MGYFRELPEVDYQSFLSDTISSKDYLRVKNLFRRNKLRDDLQNVFTLFNKYQIVEGARPDTVANEFYGNSELDWVVLMTAGIVNVRDEWPLSNQDLHNYSVKKYGLENLYNIHHYETTEVKNTAGVVVLPAGLEVESNYSFSFYDEKVEGMTIISSPVTEVTKYMYEERLQDDRRNIFLLKPRLLNVVKDDLEEMMEYKKGSTRYKSETLKTADNIRLFQ